MTLYVENQGGREFSFSVEEQLDKLTAFVTKYVGCPYEPELSVTLVTKEEIHRLNRGPPDGCPQFSNDRIRGACSVFGTVF